MSVNAQIGTLISHSFYSSVGVKPTKRTPNLLPLGTPNPKAIGFTLT
ncbi:hypothetical protein MXB_3799 [Myxobolus squamalis]|nr:hypothetical protein MXB_3799 [Myxobolus squamalis]